MSESKNAQLKKLLMGYLVIAHQELNEEQYEFLQEGRLQKYIGLVFEAVAIEYLVDKVLIQHALRDLLAKRTVEETILHVFTLYIYKITTDGSGHPLERGIIRQQINGLVPRFEQAMDLGLIEPRLYEKYVGPLLHIADNSEGTDQVLALLADDYQHPGRH
jgi:hypothetical protein